MTHELIEKEITELKRDLKGSKEKIETYDWEYRLPRFEEKINRKKEEVLQILEAIKLSDNIEFSERLKRKEYQDN